MAISKEEIEEAQLEQMKEWDETEGKEGQTVIEGFYDYKNLMINPASETMVITKAEMKKLTKNIFKLINRDLQLGYLNEQEFKIINLHLHLGTELMRFKIWDAALFFIQKAYILLVMSNSRNGSLRKLESTAIRVSKLSQDAEKGGGWLNIRRKRKD